jgi:integration host factor subunit beta
LSALFVRILKKLPYPSEQMNRSDLVQLLSDPFSQLTQGDAETAVSTILEAMNSAMVRGHRIEIRGFSSFSVIHRASRMGRNPRSGAPVEIHAARVPHFKPGKALREAVDLPT